MHGDMAGFIDRGQAGGSTGVHQVFGELGLAVHHDVFAASELVHVDAMALTVVEHLEAAVHQAFLVHALAHACFVQQVDADLLQNAGADAAEYVVPGLAFEDDGVYTGLVQQLAEQQA